MKQIAIFGAGGFGREVAMLIEQINQQQERWQLIGFFDDGVPAGTAVYGYNVLGGLQALNEYSTELHVVLAIASPQTKKGVLSQLSNTFLQYPVLVHPTALLGKDVAIGEGSIITAGNILTTNIHLGKHVILNLSCTLGHDSILGDYSAIMPAVNISGEVTIGEGAYIGTGAKIIQQITIGARAIIGAGAVVIRDIPDGATAVGNPARIVAT